MMANYFAQFDTQEEKRIKDATRQRLGELVSNTREHDKKAREEEKSKEEKKSEPF